MARFLATLFFVFTLVLSIGAQANIALLSFPKDVAANTAGIEASIVSNFDLHQGKIIVLAEINGKKGQFLLDTGAESLIINGVPNEMQSAEVVGLSEISKAEPLIINEMIWENQRFEDIPAYRMDLQELEKNMGFPLAGIIGHSILEKGALHINYEKRIVTFLPSPKYKLLKKQGWRAHHLFRMDHLLAVGLKVNGKKYFMGLDTGAEINLIAEPTDIALHPDRTRQVFGISGIKNTAKEINIRTARINDVDINIGEMFYNPFPAFEQQFNGELSGLLGFPFFANNNFILDLSNEVLYLKN